MEASVSVYQQQEIQALLHGVKSARSIAHRCLLIAAIYPKYEREEKAEAARHFARARWYLDTARMMRASR